MSVKVIEILDGIKTLTVLEKTDLVKQIEATFDVEASRPQFKIFPDLKERKRIDEELPEQTEFNVVLEEVPADKKIAILKAVRELLGLDLKNSKNFVESAPQVVKFALNLQDAEEIKQFLEGAGAKVSLK